MSQQTIKIAQSNNNKNFYNSDTFCNICKKELCNKYFLKTHLSNKHGIILQNDDNNSNSISTTTTNSNNQISYSPKPIKVSPSSPNYNIQNESDNDLNDDENNESDENNRSISQIEDFCELCKKQFCNKYYLKKHKLDVHGVLIENGIKSYKRISSESSAIVAPTTTTTTTTTSNTTVTTTISSTSNNNFSTNSKNIQQQVNNSNLPALMLMNPFLNSMMHFNHPLLTPEATAAAAAAAVASLIQPNDSSTSAAEMEQASKLLLNLNNHFDVDQKFIKNDAINNTTSITNILNENKNITSTTASIESATSNKTAEVMCNLCTKLFYTEEFLAMHKLNKHGIPLSSNDSLIQSTKEMNNFSSSSSSSATTTASTASNDKLINIRNSILKSIKNEPQQHSLNNDKENLDDIITKTRNNVLVNALYAKDILSDAKTASDLVEIDRTKFNFLASETNSSMNESYCEFCNKSFCNKYFLKTHMLRSHGKFLNNNNSNKPDFDLEDNEYLISQTQSLDAHQQHYNHHQHHHEQQQQQHQQQNNKKQFNNNNNNNSEDSDNEFNENNNNSSTFINGVIDTNFAAKIADRVVCDICNKQVCNKYFLKTHKQKVHGIQMSDTNSKLNGFCEDQNSCSSGETSLKIDYSLNNSLKIEINEQKHDNNNNENLLMNKLRQISNSTSTNSISPQQQHQQPVLQTTSQQLISRDSYCELCKRQFCSKYFLRNHMINMHGINQSKFNYNKTQSPIVPSTPPSTQTQTISTVQLKENESISKKTKLNEQINSPISSVSSSNNNNNVNSSTTPVNNANSASFSLASRVTCVICNKDLCNKYFLRQHLINVHKTSIEEYNEKFDIKNRNESEESLTVNDYATNNQMSPDNDVGGEITSSIEEESKIKLEKLKNNHLKFLSLVSESNKSLKRRKRQYSENSSVSSRSSNSVFSKYSLGSTSSSSLASEKFYDKKNKINQKVEKNDKKMIATTTKITNDDILDVDMQQFLLESSDDVFCSNFMPCMVYLPVKYKLNESVNINLTLKPIKKNRKRTYHENDEIDNMDKSRELGEIKISDKKFKSKFMTLNDNTNEQKIEIM